MVFADDLVVLSSNISKLEQVMRELDVVLDEVGMKVNAGKTKWLAYLPENPAPNLDLSLFRGFRYGDTFLENVDMFKYLGFLTSWDLTHNLHVQNRNALLTLAARMSGKLMRSLEVTNFRSLRAYYHSLVPLSCTVIVLLPLKKMFLFDHRNYFCRKRSTCRFLLLFTWPNFSWVWMT